MNTKPGIHLILDDTRLREGLDGTTESQVKDALRMMLEEGYRNI